MSTLNKISHYIQDTNYQDFPTEVISAVKRAFIDTMGVSLIGSQEKAGKIVTEFIKINDSFPVASIIGGGFKASAVDAALANGTIVHAIDYDDTGAYTQGHPSAPIFPVIIALAEEYKLSGKNVIESYVLGVEVFSRLARAMPMLHLKGWHPTAILGTIAAAAVAAKLLNLNVEQTTIALSLAGTQSSGMIKSFGTMAKPFHIGRAASNGITSALLAKSGFTASESFFEEELNFADTIFGSKDHKIEHVADKIGNPLAIITPGINIKQYPSCSLTHRAIDGILYLLNKNSFSISDVDLIECFVPPRAKIVLRYNNPSTGLQAKFSMQFVLACAIKFKEVGVKHFTSEIVNSKEIKELIKKIVFEVHHDWQDGDDARSDVVRVKLKNGRILEKDVAIPKGNAQVPLLDEEVIKKYHSCTDGILSKKKLDESLRLMQQLEELQNINKIMDIVRC